MAKALLHPTRKAVFLVTAQLQEPPRYGDHLDRVERGDGPLQRFRLSDRIARHQPVAFPGEIQQSGSAFEYLDAVVL
jgi:hypothetical protein